MSKLVSDAIVVNAHLTIAAQGRIRMAIAQHRGRARPRASPLRWDVARAASPVRVDSPALRRARSAALATIPTARDRILLSVTWMRKDEDNG